MANRSLVGPLLAAAARRLGAAGLPGLGLAPGGLLFKSPSSLAGALPSSSSSRWWGAGARTLSSSAGASTSGSRGGQPGRDDAEATAEDSQLDKAVQHVRRLMRHEKRVGRGGMGHEVIEVDVQGKLTRYTITDLDVLQKVFDKSFQFRDLGLLHVDGVRRQAEVLVRDRTIILRLFEVQAIIQSDWCMFFGAHRPHVELAGQLLKRQIRAERKAAAKAAESAGRAGGNPPEAAAPETPAGLPGFGDLDPGPEVGKSFSTEFVYDKKRSGARETLRVGLAGSLDGLDDDTFEQKALQIALTSSISRLNHQAGQIGMLVDLVLRDIGNDVESLRKVLPLKQKVEALRTDTESVNFVLTETLEQDEDMANMNLTWIDENEGLRPLAQDHLEVEAILETGRREVQQIGRILTEINERIDDTREVLNISLDSQRNRILTLNLQTSLLTLSLTAIAVPAGILGMNIPLGLEEDPTAFSTVISAMGAVGICMYIVPVSYLYYGFFRTSKTRVKEVVALQNLVHDMDVIERTFYKMAATGEVSKKDFKAAMDEATGRQISDAEMELICKAFDEDGDDQLQLETYRRIIEQSISSKKKFT